MSVDPDRDAARCLLDRMYTSGDLVMRLNEANERARKAEKDRDEIRALLLEVLESPLCLMSTPLGVPITVREALQDDLHARAEQLAGAKVK